MFHFTSGQTDATKMACIGVSVHTSIHHIDVFLFLSRHIKPKYLPVWNLPSQGFFLMQKMAMFVCGICQNASAHHQCQLYSLQMKMIMTFFFILYSKGILSFLELTTLWTSFLKICSQKLHWYFSVRLPPPIYHMFNFPTITPYCFIHTFHICLSIYHL